MRGVGLVAGRVNGVDHGQHQPHDEHQREHARADEQGEHLLAGPLRCRPLLPATAAEHQQPFPVIEVMIT